MTASSFRRLVKLLPLLVAGAMLPLGCTSTAKPPTTADRAPQADNIRVGDRLIIRITGVPDEQVLAEPIDGDGEISMPNLGRIKAAGKTPSDLEREIETLYIQRRIYTTPNITVSIEQRFVSVIGEVKSERRIAYTRDLTALNAIRSEGWR